MARLPHVAHSSAVRAFTMASNNGESVSDQRLSSSAPDDNDVGLDALEDGVVGGFADMRRPKKRLIDK